MPEKKIVVKLEGSRNDREDVRLNDFINQLNSVKKALRENERTISGGEEIKIDYKVVGLSHDSPSTIILEPVPRNGALPIYTNDVVTSFSNEIRLIRKKGELAREPEFDRLQAYRELGSKKDNLITKIKISVGRISTTIDDVFQEKLEKIFGPDELISGSISGMLDIVNVHNTNKFTLYPVLGSRRVSGIFGPGLRPKVKEAIGSFVTVIGELRYKQWSPFPHEVVADDLQAHPPENELPTLSELRGAFRGVTGNLSSASFVEKIRNESW
jgi:hypothetical protein